MEKKKTTTRRKKKKNTFGDTAKMFSRFEVLFIVVLFLGFFIWAFSKCSNRGTTPPPNTTNTENPQSTENIEDTGADLSPAAANNPNSPTYDLNEAEEPAPTANASNLNGEVEVVSRDNRPASEGRRSYTPLYVTLQDLKVRKGPSRDSSIITVLTLHEEVMFMEKRTGFREKINIGTEVTNEPWVYIQTKKGQKGWVYGAGIHYFKWDRLKDPIPSISEEVEESAE